jgi:tetratricopeptide (TPR) repeat protein
MAFINLVLLHYILEKYNDNYPDSPYMLSQFASVYLLMGDFKKAKEYYSKLKQMGIDDENISRILNELENK